MAQRRSDAAIIDWPIGLKYAAGRMHKVRTLIRGPAFVLAALIVLGSLSCSSGGDGNLLENAGFEDGEDPWFILGQSGFERSVEIAYSGEASSHLQLDTIAEASGNDRSNLVQDVEAEEFPETISGVYRIEDWTEGAPVQFVQVAAIVFNANNLEGEFPNHQVHYILAGTASDPGPETNIRNVQLGDELTLNQWVRFQADLSQDFSELWGAVPEGFELIRLVFEVRFEDKEPGSAPVQADVFFDDLYLGPPPD